MFLYYLCKHCQSSWELYVRTHLYAIVTCQLCIRQSLICFLCNKGKSQSCSTLRNFKKHVERKYPDIFTTLKVIKYGACKQGILVITKGTSITIANNQHISHSYNRCNSPFFNVALVAMCLLIHWI